MGRKAHNPSLTRKIARGLKQGQSPESLVSTVDTIVLGGSAIMYKVSTESLVIS